MAGKFYEVRDSLNEIRSDIGKRIVSLDILVGVFDIIIEATADTPEDFFRDILRRIIEIPQISNITTFTVIRPSPYRRETEAPLTGYIFVSAVPQRSVEVQDRLSQLPDVVSVDLLLGTYDILLKTTAPVHTLPDYIDELQKVVEGGIKRSTTCMPVEIVRRLRAV